MISIPAYAVIAGITVFRDDEDKSKFFYLPRAPKLMTFPDGKPMFSFMRYQFPLVRTGTNTEPGGGYLLFTTAMVEDPAVVNNQLLPELKRLMRAEDPTATTVVEPKIAPVDFTEGDATLIIMRDNRMVGTITLGKPSLLGENTLSVATELTSNGATLFHDALTGGLGVAAVEYNLQFPVRLPAIIIRGHVDSKEVKEAVMGYTTERVTDESTWGDTHHNETHRTSVSEKMESLGLVSLEILKGSVDLSNDDMESLRAFAFRAMDEFVKKHLLTGGTVETSEERRSAWITYLGQNVTARFDLYVAYRDVINRRYNPSAQISPAFLGVPVADVMRDIDLQNAPWYFNTLTVKVDTNLDFAKYGDFVHSVVGHLSYDQRKPDGTRVAARKSVSFTATDRAQKDFETRVAEVGKDTYRVDLEVNYKNGPREQAKIGSFDTSTRNLTLSVPNPGVIDLMVSAAPEAFTGELKSIEVEIEYGDQANGVPKATETVTLNTASPSKQYTRTIYARWEKPFHYRVTYVHTTQRVTTPWMEGTSGNRYLTISTPIEDMFVLQVLGSADWKEVAQVVVDLEYIDRPNDYRSKVTLAFAKDTAQRQTWTFPLRNPAHREFTWRQTLLLTNGGVRRSGDQTRPSDGQVLVTGNAPGGVVTIDVDPADIGIPANAARVVARMTYADVPNDVLDTETLIFRDGAVKQWVVARADAKKNDYLYDVEYFLRDGTRKRVMDQTGVITSVADYLALPPVPTT